MHKMKMFKRSLNIWPTEYWKLHLLHNGEYGNFFNIFDKEESKVSVFDINNIIKISIL